MAEPTPAEHVARLRTRYPHFCVSDDVWTQAVRDHLHPGQGPERLRALIPRSLLDIEVDDHPEQPTEGDPPQ